jgi:chloramphenicol 3-O-phosphotransferase
VTPRVIVVNGGSSSGKTCIVRQLQGILAEPWLAATAVHRDVVYNVEVDTTRTSAEDCARSIATVLHLT